MPTPLRHPDTFADWWYELPGRRAYWWRWLLRERSTGWLRWGMTSFTSSGYNRLEPPDDYAVAPPLRRVWLWFCCRHNGHRWVEWHALVGEGRRSYEG